MASNLTDLLYKTQTFSLKQLCAQLCKHLSSILTTTNAVLLCTLFSVMRNFAIIPCVTLVDVASYKTVTKEEEKADEVGLENCLRMSQPTS